MKRLLIPSILACILGACATDMAAARKSFLDSTDVGVSVEYGGVKATDTITNGRRRIGLDVDAKEIQRLQSR